MADDSAYERVGFSLDPETLDALDDLKREWDSREARHVSRSEVAREALALGVLALEAIDKEYDRLSWSTRDRQAIVREGLQQYFEADE